MSLNDVFGEFPGRPDHPDFAKLADVVLQQDGRSYDEDFDMGTHLAQFIDPDSLRHMAQQRAMLMIGKLPARLTMEAMVATIASAYLDAFMAGYLFHERKGDTSTKE